MTYADALARKLGPDYNVNPNLVGGAKLALALVGTLTLLLAIAVAGPVLPASWSARTRTGPALHAE